MNIDNRLDLLRQIKEVDAPPFLLTRIRQQIQNLGNVEAPAVWKWSFAITSVLILVLNISIFFKPANASKEKSAAIEAVVNSLNLASTNNIYNE